MPTQQEQRAKRIRELKRIFLEIEMKDETADYRKLISEMAEHWNVSQKTAKEHIDHLIHTGFAKRHDFNNQSWVWINPFSLHEFKDANIGIYF